MIYIILLLLIIIAVLLVYLRLINRQLKRMDHILDCRLKEHTSQIVSVDMINRHINRLANSINECLKAEENLRLNSVKEEKKFKEMMANISHDLRTPLTAVRGYQQLLEKEPLTQEQQGRLRIAMKHTDILGKLIEHFFEYSYMLNYMPKCNPEKINLTNQVVEALVESITLFEERGMEVDFDDSVQTYVMADKEFMSRILQNLIRNCVQHASGIIYVRMIEEATKEKPGMVGLSFLNKIADGQSIDTDRLFDRFYIADRARKQSTGLGLAIVKLLTEQMDGQVSATITEGMLDIRVMLPKAI